MNTRDMLAALQHQASDRTQRSQQNRTVISRIFTEIEKLAERVGFEPHMLVESTQVIDFRLRSRRYDR